MERLTEYINKVPAIDTTKVRYHFEANGMIGGDVAKRLAAYEDTGMTPEEIVTKCHTLAEYHKEADPLLRARAEGRLLVLPCPLGTTVFQAKRIMSPGYPYPVTTYRVFEEEFDFCHLRYWGKSCFLTREEAEAALKGEG